MFKQKQWLAVVRGNHWIVAKVARRKLKLDIIRLSEFHAQSEVESNNEQDQRLESELSVVDINQDEKRIRGGNKTDLIKGWLYKNHVPVKKLRIAVSCPGVITRMITLPLMSTQDLDKLLTEQVDQYFTLNISDYVVDYRVLEHLIEDEEMRQRVLLAALPKYQWERLWSEWEDIGFKPDVVDLAVDGLARLYSQLTLNSKSKIKSKKNTAESETPLDLAIIELSADRVEFILLEHGVLFLYSDLEVSLDELDQVALSVKGTQEVAHGDDPDLQIAKLHDWAKTEIKATLRNVLQSLTEFFVFFAARHYGKAIDRIYLTGDYSDLPFLQEIIQTNTGVYTQVGFPNAWRPRFSKMIRPLQKNGMKYGSLYGLAMREG